MNTIRTHDRSSPLTHRRGGAAKGCLIALAIVLVIAIGLGIWIATSWKSLAGGAMTFGMNSVIDTATLPDSERPEMKAIVEATNDGWVDGTIADDAYARVAEMIFAADALVVGAANAFEATYIPASGLSDEEKADGQLQLRRVADGLHDGDLDRAAVAGIFSGVRDTNVTIETNGEEVLVLLAPSALTDAQITAVIDAARTLADDNGVGQTPDAVDPSDMLQAEIDAAIAGTPRVTAAPAGTDADADTDAQE